MSTRSKLSSLKLSARAAARGLPFHKNDGNAPKGSPRLLRWLLAISLFANLVLAVWLWPTSNEADTSTDRPKYTQQEINKAVNIVPGMGKDAVAALLGEPVVKEFSNKDEEWQYCKTGKVVDEYIAVSFENGKAISLQYYTVSTLDITAHYGEQVKTGVIGAGGWGDCRLGVRWGTYNQKKPDAPEFQSVHKRMENDAASTPR